MFPPNCGSSHIGVRVNDEIFVSASLTCFNMIFSSFTQCGRSTQLVLGFSEETVLNVAVDKVCPCEEVSLGSH